MNEMIIFRCDADKQSVANNMVCTKIEKRVIAHKVRNDSDINCLTNIVAQRDRTVDITIVAIVI